MRLHYQYDRLTVAEQDFVDQQIRIMFNKSKRPPLAGDNRCERFADAMAEWIIASRGRKPVSVESQAIIPIPAQSPCPPIGLDDSDSAELSRRL